MVHWCFRLKLISKAYVNDATAGMSTCDHVNNSMLGFIDLDKEHLLRPSGDALTLYQRTTLARSRSHE